MTTYMQAPNGEVFTTSNPDWHKDSKPLSAKAGAKARQEYCAKELRKILKPGQQVYCLLRDVSRSGMSRTISLYVIERGAKGKPPGLRCIDSLAADCTGYRLADNRGIKVGGCGMDMGFQLVYSLGASVWPKGTPRPHGKRNGEPDSEGGYALKHDWL